MTGVPRRWFLATRPDVLGLLQEQMRITDECIASFARWSADGATQDATQVREGEHAGDRARRALVAGLQAVLATPLDQEDLYTISDRLDAVQDLAKNIVRLAQETAWVPDVHAGRMAEAAGASVGRLVTACAALPADLDGAGRAADEAIKAARAVEKRHRVALVELTRSDRAPTGLVLAADFYRRYGALGDAIVGVSHRVWYAVLKQG